MLNMPCLLKESNVDINFHTIDIEYNNIDMKINSKQLLQNF